MSLALRLLENVDRMKSFYGDSVYGRLASRVETQG